MHGDKNLIILISLLYTSFSFLIIPTIYLFLYNKGSLKFLRPENKIQFTPLMLSIITVVTIIPFVTILIKLNASVAFPAWLSELENYLRETEENARHVSNFLLDFGEPKDLLMAILTIAIIPGIVEELFFRGMVQIQLQDALKNSHHAILMSAFLFSFFHFQFYGFIPRFIFGVLLGYIFFWSKNIWYSCAAHVMNNLIGVLGGYFMGPRFLSTDDGGFTSIVLLIPSVAVTVLAMLLFKRIKHGNFKEDKLTI